jgi:hypothetical protein
MKTIPASSKKHRPDRRVIALGAVLLSLCGCAREDEELQSQLVETRAALAAKTKALEQAEAQRTSQPPPAPAQPPAVSTEELANARSRIADLESQLAAAKQQASIPPAPAKLDLDALKDKLEGDLTNKAKTLRELLLKQAGVARIDEIGIRAIEYPPEIVAPFRSAITFALSSSDGRQLRLVFPVTADLDGSWSLPGPDKVQQAYKQVKDAAPAEPNVAAAPAETLPANQVPTPGQAPGSRAPSTTPQLAPSGALPSGFRQVDANTFQFDWGDGKKGGAKPGMTQPASPAPPTPASSAPVVSAPQEIRRAVPSTPAAPAQPEITIPKPVMPVQRDIIIKF